MYTTTHHAMYLDTMCIICYYVLVAFGFCYALIVCGGVYLYTICCCYFYGEEVREKECTQIVFAYD